MLKMSADFDAVPTEFYLDNAATASKYPAAIDEEAYFYREINANPLRGLYKKSVQATTGVNEARKWLLRLVHADESYTVIFSRGTTEALNLMANGLIKDDDGFGVVSRDDKVVVDIESHHSNILPWKQRYENFVLSKDVKKDIDGAKVVSLTGVSNVTGEYFLKRIRNARRTLPKAILGVDGAQMVGHVDFDIKRTGVDFVAFSGHKFGAPMGIGGLIIKKELAEKLRPLNYGGEMVNSVSEDGTPTYTDIPERLEAGTLPVGAIFGLCRATEMAINELNTQKDDYYYFDDTLISRHVKRAVDGLSKIEHVKILAANNLIITFQVEGVHPHDVAQVLADENVMVRAGWLCAEPYLRYMGWGPVVRASFCEYDLNGYAEALVNAVKKVRKKMGLE